MIKLLSQMECEVNGKRVCVQCEPNMPIVDFKESLFQFLKYAGQIEDAGKAAQAEKEQSQEESKVEELKEG